MTSIQDLPTELLQHVFSLAVNPQLRLVNKTFHTISRCDRTRAMYLQTRFREHRPNSQEDLSIIYSLTHSLLNIRTIPVMVRRGADLQGDNEFFLRWSAANNHVEFLQFYLQHLVANINTKGSIHVDNDYPLRVAAQNGHLDAVRMIVEHGGDIHVGQDHPLRSASQFQHESVIMYLLEQGADIHADNDFVFRTTASEGKVSLARKLLRCGADARAEMDESLILACVHGHSDMIELLLTEAHCDVHAREEMPLRAAIQYEQWSVIRMLLQHGANATTEDHLLLRKLVEADQWDLLMDLLREQQHSRLDVNAANGLLLWKAAHRGDLLLVERLLQCGANVTQRSNLLSSLAANRKGHSTQMADIARLLCQRGATMEKDQFLDLRKAKHPFCTIVSTHQRRLAPVKSTSSVRVVAQSIKKVQLR